jgi:MinD superfamily P-loop ATPase
MEPVIPPQEEEEDEITCYICRMPIHYLEIQYVSKKYLVMKHEGCDGSRVCVVCGKPIKFIGKKVGLGFTVTRHAHCSPGSSNWMKAFGKFLSEWEFEIMKKIKADEEEPEEKPSLPRRRLNSEEAIGVREVLSPTIPSNGGVDDPEKRLRKRPIRM